jgi:hypothetical protein
VRFELVESAHEPATRDNITQDYNYPINLQAALALALNVTTANLPAIRTCFEYTQRLDSARLVVTSSGSTFFQQRIRTCNVAACAGGFTYDPDGAPCRTPVLYAEISSGGAANLDHAALAASAAAAANDGRLSTFGIVRGAVSSDPFNEPRYLPYINGVYLGIAIGVACGLFLLVIFGCVIFYWIKSRREVYGAVMGQTDSTASVQSGSSMRSDVTESQASASEF